MNATWTGPVVAANLAIGPAQAWGTASVFLLAVSTMAGALFGGSLVA